MSSSHSEADPLTREKATLRKGSLARRDALSAAERDAAAVALAARPLPVTVLPGLVVSGYSAIRSELDPLPLLARFAAAGARLALPVVVGRGKPLLMRAWTIGEALVPAPFGLSEPGPDAPALDPDVLLVPLACFDRRGQRIGYGAGHYDMTLAALRARKPVVAIGLAYAVQEIPQVPAAAWDAPLDLVLTDQAVIDFR